MKTLVIAIALTVTVTAAHAKGGYSHPNYSSFGSNRSSQYVYRNPYSAYPSVRVHGYKKSDGTFVQQYYRTPANYTIKDNLNYRGYGTIRLPQ